MPIEPNDWVPTSDDVAYWRFLRKTSMECRAHLCLSDGQARMWTRPREPWMREVFLSAHAGHQHVMVADVLDRFSAKKSG